MALVLHKFKISQRAHIVLSKRVNAFMCLVHKMSQSESTRSVIREAAHGSVPMFF